MHFKNSAPKPSTKREKKLHRRDLAFVVDYAVEVHTEIPAPVKAFELKAQSGIGRGLLGTKETRER